MNRFRNWGASGEELTAKYPCDEVLPSPDDCLFRAIDVSAPSPIAYRWLCQLKVAPYSYDWIDNLGRKSPVTLSPGAEELSVGERIMTIFRIVSFEWGRHLTLELDYGRSLCGEWCVSYTVRNVSEGTSRYVVKLNVRYPTGSRVSRLWRKALCQLAPPADLFMMRKQLITLKKLSERS
jgi:hypothetical protein